MNKIRRVVNNILVWLKEFIAPIILTEKGDYIIISGIDDLSLRIDIYRISVNYNHPNICIILNSIKYDTVEIHKQYVHVLLYVLRQIPELKLRLSPLAEINRCIELLERYIRFNKLTELEHLNH